MKYILPMLLCGAVVLSCVDDTYDLTKIESDNIVIGDDESVFRAPLATFHVAMDELESNGVNVKELCAEADIWLPTELDGGYVDIERTATDSDYLQGLLDALTDEILGSEEKLNTVVTLIYDRYREYVDIPFISEDVTLEDYIALFTAALNSELLRDVACQAVHTLAGSYLSTLHLDTVTYEVDHIDLDDEMVDMIVDNLDPDAGPGDVNSLCIYGTVTNNLPLSLNVSPELRPTSVCFDIDIEACGVKSEIPLTQVSASDLRQIVDGVTLTLPMTMKRYYRDVRFSEEGDQLVLSLSIVKWGGLSFETL